MFDFNDQIYSIFVNVFYNILILLAIGKFLIKWFLISKHDIKCGRSPVAKMADLSDAGNDGCRRKKLDQHYNLGTKFSYRIFLVTFGVLFNT